MSEHDKWERWFDLFGIKNFIPHGYCLSWSPLLLWLHAISDLLITLAYYSIPFIIISFIRRRKDFPCPWLTVLFAGFIVACGTMHLLSAVAIWIPLYWLDGLLKACTAIISVATAVLMLRAIPSALSAPSARQLQAEIEQRKSTEKALLISNVRLQKNIARTQLLLDSALDGIISMDHNGKVIGWNAQAGHIFGYLSEQVLGREMAELIIPPAYRERHRQGLSRFLATGSSNIIGKRLEITGLRADASEFPMELTVGALNQRGNYFFSAYVRDISERKQMEEKLRDSENRLNTILDSVEAYIYIKDCNYQYQYANKPVRQLFGQELEDIIGKTDSDFFNESSAAKLRENDRHIIELGQRMATEEINIDKISTAANTYLSVKQPLRREDGSIYGLCGISTDISERKQMENALRESEYRWKFAIEGSGDGVWDRDFKTDEVKYSGRWKEMLGYAEDDILPTRQDWLNRIHPDDQSYVAGVVQAYLEGNQATYVVEHRLRCKDDSYKWILARGSVVSRSGDGKPLRMIGTHTDISERKQADQALQQSRKELQEAQRIAHMGSWQLDLTTHRVVWSEELYRMLGLNPELPPPDYTEYFRLFTPESWERLSSALLHTQKTGGSYELELEMVRVDGTRGWMLARGEAIRDDSGAIVRLHGVALDITERKIMENELKTSEAKFRSIIEVSPVPMALHDEQLNITLLNPAFVQTFGYNMDDIPTLADWWTKAYLDPVYRDWAATTWQKTLEKAKQEQTEYPPMEVDIHCKNNSIKTVLASAAAIHHDFSGEHLVILYDITPRKQIEARLNSIFNASVEGIITTDMADTIVSANAAVETMFGYKPEDLVGCSINKLIQSSPKQHKQTIDDYNFPHSIKSIGQIQEVEGIYNNGSVVPLDLSVAEFSIDNAHYFTHIVRDVSSRKHREQQDKAHLDELAHVTRLGLMGEMASGIAHEVNQPLAAISSYTQVSINLIHTENPDLLKLTEILYKTQQQALRAGRIIHRMREFVKSHSIHRSTTDLNILIHDAVGLCIAELKQNDIRLTFELGNNLPPLSIDYIQIEQVIINLIRNSIEALQNIPTERQRHITIHSHLIADNAVGVRVKDNGPGLDKDQQQKILTPFYTTKADGMGMGLSISRSLIEAHEGTLHFNSKPGKGTTFHFTLPIQKS